MVSQSQPNGEDDLPSDDEMTKNVDLCASERSFDSMTTPLNVSLEDDNLSNHFEL